MDRGDLAIAEATLNLNALTGIWATVYARQDHLYAIGAENAAVDWRKLTRGLDVAATVSAFQSRAGDFQPDPAASKADQERDRRAALKALAVAMLLAMLAGLPGMPGFAALLASIDAALTAAAAEGYASALAVAASQQGYQDFGWDAAAKDGAVQSPPMGSAAAVAALITAGVVTDLAVTLTGMAVAGATAAAMTAAVRAYLRDPKSLVLYLQDAMGKAIHAAVIAVFGRAQVERVLLITAGDARVCPVCDALEAANPYTVADSPHPPIHPRCRCALHAEGGNAALFSMLAAYITDRRAAA